MSGTNRLELVLESGNDVRRGLVWAVLLGVFVAVLSLVLRRVSPGFGIFSVAQALLFGVITAIMNAGYVFAAGRAREHVIVTSDGIVQTRRMLRERTRRFEVGRISRIRYAPVSNRFFDRSVGATGEVLFQYGGSGLGRLAVARSHDEGRTLAQQIDSLLGHPEEPDDFFSHK